MLFCILLQIGEGGLWWEWFIIIRVASDGSGFIIGGLSKAFMFIDFIIGIIAFKPNYFTITLKCKHVRCSSI
jgi:hypothetical protein